MRAELKNLIDRINGLRPAWSKLSHFTAMEMYELRDSTATLAGLEDGDWQLISEFFAYTPRDREQFARVTKRASFLQDPSGTLAAAQEWAKTHRRHTPKPVAKPQHTEPQEDLSPDEMRAILRGADSILDSEPVDEIKPKPRTGHGQTSFFD